MDYVGVIAEYQMGAAVHAVVIGNSVSCGFNGAGWKNIPQILQRNGKIKPEFRESDIPQSAPTKLRAFLKARNPVSTVVNLCGSGWDTNDHLGIKTQKSGVVGQTDTLEDVRRLKTRPSVVFLPLQINDANHGLSIETFTTNTNRIITELEELGIVVVIVKENYTRIPGYPEFIDRAGSIAKERNLSVINTYIPSKKSDLMLSDYAHPNSWGHSLIFGEYVKWFSFYWQP